MTRKRLYSEVETNLPPDKSGVGLASNEWTIYETSLSLSLRSIRPIIANLTNKRFLVIE
jgi:hypothetical protein